MPNVPKVNPVDVRAVGGSLYAEVVGDGHVTVVFEAGMGMTRTSWGASVAELADDFRCVIYDRRGLGRSPSSDRPRDIAHMVEDLGAVVDATAGTEPAILVGHSWGGPVIRSFAARRPESVKGLVLVDQTDERCPLYFSKATRLQFRVMPKIVPTLAVTGMLKLLARRQSKAVPEPWASAMRAEEGTRRAGRGQIAEHVTVIAEVDRLASDPPQLPDVPVVAISGGNAGMMGRALRQQLVDTHHSSVEALPHGRHVMASKSGHMIPFTEPGVIAEAVRSVLAESLRI